MTIKDIAELAGVSPGTVSKVLNNRTESISEETRERVLRIVKEYNFKPFQRFIQSDSSFSGLVGLLVPGETKDYVDFIAGAQSAASDKGYSMILCSFKDKLDAEKHLHSLFGKNVDGVALYLNQDIDLDSLFANSPEKTAYATASNVHNLVGKCAVSCDFTEAAKDAVEHLLQLGHRKIALVGWQAHFLSSDLVEGFNEALYSRGIVPDRDSQYLCKVPEDVADGVRQFTYGGGTAFLCQDIQIASYVRRALSRYGLHVPRDYSVIGISPQGTSPDIFARALTVVDVQLQEMGKALMESLIAKVESGAKSPEQVKRYPPLVRVGGTTSAPYKGSAKRIVVVGSMNMDVIIHMSHIPTSGESLRAKRILNLPGGKGANQGVGVAKLGGRVSVIGCLGGDQEGRLLFNSLTENGVNTSGVQVFHERPTGKAYILVAENGESTIVRAHGANDELRPGIVDANISCFDGAEFCLISTEMPWDTVLFTIDLCSKRGIKTIVKPTVQRKIPPEVLKKITYLIPNEKELEVQVEGADSVEEKAARLFSIGAENVIVTLGEKGCYLHNGAMKCRFPAAPFQAVDTTGAGDAFISALAVYISEGHDITSSIGFATYAAGLSITRDGVQPALADRMALEIYAESYNKIH